MPFPGYPLPATWVNESTMLDEHALAHNATEVALNDLQNQVTTLTAQVSALTSQIASLQAFDNQFGSAWTAYTPTLYNVTVGTGTRSGEFLKIGRLVVVRAGFVLGTGFTMSSTVPFDVGLPAGIAAKGSPEKYPIGTAWANNSNYRYSGSCLVLNTAPDRVARFANENTPLGWKQGYPFTWAAGDSVTFTIVFESTS